MADATKGRDYKSKSLFFTVKESTKYCGFIVECHIKTRAAYKDQSGPLGVTFSLKLTEATPVLKISGNKSD